MKTTVVFFLALYGWIKFRSLVACNDETRFEGRMTFSYICRPQSHVSARRFAVACCVSMWHSHANAKCAVVRARENKTIQRQPQDLTAVSFCHIRLGFSDWVLIKSQCPSYCIMLNGPSDTRRNIHVHVRRQHCRHITWSHQNCVSNNSDGL